MKPDSSRSKGNNPLLAQMLRKYRLMAGYSQKSVAQALGITRSAYTYYETGKTSPDPTSLRLISQIFDVPLESFFSEEDAPAVGMHDSGMQRAPKKVKADPQRVGDLSAGEKDLIAYLRAQNVSGEAAMEMLQKLRMTMSLDSKKQL